MRRYDVTASIYDMRYSKEQTAKIEAALANLEIGEEASVLDVGCGTGLLFNHLGSEHQGWIVGLDISKKTLCEAKVRSTGLANAHLLLGDADYLPFQDDVFDYVFAFTLIQNMPNPLRSLKEFRWTAAPHGHLIVTGLKSIFTRKQLENLLSKAGLRVAIMEEEDLKCFVAVCVTFD
jgi:ubiquinone/menaquinone biosynthesis C-methylase UbiE